MFAPTLLHAAGEMAMIEFAVKGTPLRTALNAVKEIFKQNHYASFQCAELHIKF